MLKLIDIYKLEISKIMHKFSKQLSTIKKTNMFVMLDDLHSYNTRRKDQHNTSYLVFKQCKHKNVLFISKEKCGTATIYPKKLRK